MIQHTIAIPRIEATASVTVNLPPSFERRTEPLRAPPYVVEGEIIAAADDYQPPPRGRWRVPALFGVLAAISLVLGAGMGLVIAPMLFAGATITLTPESHP